MNYNNDGHKDDMKALIPVAADNEQINYDIDGDEIEQHHYDIDDNIENFLRQSIGDSPSKHGKAIERNRYLSYSIFYTTLLTLVLILMLTH